MKNPINLLLAALTLLSLPVCIWAWFFDLRLILFIPAIPFFCLQFLLLRVTRPLVLRLLPVWLVLLTASAGAYICLTASGWDTLLGWILLSACIAPAVGCILAWAFWALRKLVCFCEGRRT